MMDEFMHGWRMAWWWVMGILIFIFLIQAVARPVRSRKLRNHGGRSALQVIEERYAKDEIDKEEFERKKKDLQNK